MIRSDELKIRKREVEGRLKTVENEIKALTSGLTSSDMLDVKTVQPRPEEMKRLSALRQRIVMERNNVDAEIQLLENRIRRLRFWLTIESVGGVSIGTLVSASFYLSPRVLGRMPTSFFYLLPVLAAVAFLPFLLHTLIKLKQYGWIWILLIMVGGPGILNFIPINDKFFALAFQLFPLLMFYAYCGILRWAVEDWVEY